MSGHILRRCGIVAGISLAMVAAAVRTHGQAAGEATLQSPAASLTALHLKFNGAASCSNSDCHGGSKAKENGYSFSNEYTLWSSEGDSADPHHSKTWAALKNDTGKKIAKGLGIADATKSERCLSCHALSVPAALQGKNFKLTEGVTCNACHGPSEKYLDPHSKKGWYKQETAKNDFQGMLTKWGLYNTLPVQARAERCTSCHLAIEPDLVAKGHPQPTFELNYFSETYPNRHWHDPDGYFKAKLWAGGQQVALREALKQLATRTKVGGKPLQDAYMQAMAHYSMMNQILTASMPGSAPALAAAVQKVQAAYTAKAGVDTAASAAADVDGKLAPAVELMKPTKATVIKMLGAVANQADLATKFGKSGQDQQSYAIFALYSAYASAEKPADAEAVTSLIGDKLFPEQPPTPSQYAQNLAAVKAKLPK